MTTPTNQSEQEELREQLFDAINNNTIALVDEGQPYLHNVGDSVDAIMQLIQSHDEARELRYFSYSDWETGDDDILRIGDYINCNHQRGFDGAETNFEGQIVRHHDNGMPVVIHNVDPKEPENSGDYASLEDMFMQGWEFSRLKELTARPNEHGEE